MSGTGMIIRSVALGAGLAMDAFSVSIANGLRETDMKRSRQALIAGVYAFFQFLMPIVGWLCVRRILNVFHSFEKAIPWVALILLLCIGGKMLIEGLSKSRSVRKDPSVSGAETEGDPEGYEEGYEEGSAVREAAPERIAFASLILQGIATSIDALSVGLAFASYSWKEAFLCAIIIAAVTFLICLGGLALGRFIGRSLSGKAEILGGVILIIIGIEIFVRGVFF